MKDYTNKNPVFSRTLEIAEESDPAHADILNATSMQLMQNTLSNRDLLNTFMRYSYDSDRKCVVQMLPFDCDNGTIKIPDGMGRVSGNVLILEID